MRKFTIIRPNHSLKQFYMTTIKKKQFIYILLISFSFGFIGLGLNSLAILNTGKGIDDVLILFCGISVLLLIMLFLSPVVTYRKFKSAVVELGDAVLYKNSSVSSRIQLKQIRFICLLEETDVVIELKKLKSIPIRDLTPLDLSFIEEWARANKISVLKGTSFLDFVFK